MKYVEDKVKENKGIKYKFDKKELESTFTEIIQKNNKLKYDTFTDIAQ